MEFCNKIIWNIVVVVGISYHYTLSAFSDDHTAAKSMIRLSSVPKNRKSTASARLAFQ
jgi:hypothetical protein